MLNYSVEPTKFGDVLVVSSGNGLRALLFLEGELPSMLQRIRLKGEGVTEGSDEVQRQALEMLESFPTGLDIDNLPLDLKGTAFQRRVWQELIKIPFGSTTSYAALAESVGHPSAVRAVANAVGANPVAILIPCHRVIRSDCSLGGYRWGQEIKRRLLSMERNGHL